MTVPAGERPPRLVLRFAFYSALSLLLAGAAIFWFVGRAAIEQAERDLLQHATSASKGLAERLTAEDLGRPAGTERRRELDRAIRAELRPGIVRLKIWNAEGTLIYSDNHALIGTETTEPHELPSVLQGGHFLEETNLRDHAAAEPDLKALEATVPLTLRGSSRPVGMLELYEDYGVLAADVRETVTPVAVVLMVGLLLLYAALFPILRQVTRALEQRTRSLTEQSEALRRTLAAREQTEQKLREAEASYRALVEQLPLVTYMDELNESSSTIYMSPQIEPLLGYRPEEWTRDPELFPKLLHPEDRERVLALHREQYAKGESFSADYRFVAKDGGAVWVHDEVMIVRDAEGNPQHAQGFMLDITERKEAEDRLGEAEARYRTLVEQLPLAMYMRPLDMHDANLYVSPQVEAMLGYPARSWVDDPDTLSRIVHPDDVEMVIREGERVRETGEPFRGEYRCVAADGRIVWVLDETYLVRDEEGRPAYVQGFLLDVTARRAAESARAQLAAIVESSDDAIISADAEGLITSWNSGAERTFGWTAAEAVGQHVAMLAPDDRREEPQSFLERVVAGEALQHHEVVRRRKDGATIDVSLTLSPVRDVAGNVVGISAICRDVTGRKQAQRELERLLVLEREQNERLRELDRLKDEFVALVSHELRTPLTSIRGYLELVLDGEAGEVTDEQRQFLAVVERNAHRLLALVGDLLFLAQIEAGKLALEVGAVDLAAIASESVEAARPLAEQRDIGLSLAAGPVSLLAGDRARLSQLLDNLISNALKFTPEGGRVDVRLRTVRGRAELEVRDTGIGIPASEQSRLFERFFRSSNATDRQIQGTGLGLAICKAIVEAHGGRITVASEENAGTTFRISLPVRHTLEREPEAEAVAL